MKYSHFSRRNKESPIKGLEQVKRLARYRQIEIGLARFNSQFGSMILGNVQPADIENYQAKRKAEGKADATVDDEIGIVKTMVRKGFENRKVGADTFRTFERVKKLLKRNSKCQGPHIECGRV